ncbi:MAG: DedA family protein [Sphingomonas bacterium]|nr:DedA family protein [Sphingomonas bacterium]
MTSVNQWVEHYGVLGVFLMAAAEGEIGVLIGGAMAHLGRLNPVLVALAAWIGSFVSTQAFFHLGRSQREGRWVSRIKRRRAFAKTLAWIERQPKLFCFFYRFVYGFRIAGPVGISLSGVDSRTFALINLFSALLWGIAATALGWWAGPTVFMKLGQWFDWHDLLIVGGGAVAMLLILLAWRRMRAKGE